MENHIGFSGCRVLVTGASSGLGAALTGAFHAAGAELVLAGRDAAGLAERSAELGGTAACHVYEQSDRESVRALARAAGPVDVLVNNAGVLLVQPLIETPPEEFERIVATDLVGPMILARLVGEGMLARGRGVIVNIASQLAFCGAEGRGVYAAAKAGLAQFTRTAGAEWIRHGVRVVGVAPGRMRTPMTAYLMKTEAEARAGLARVPAGRYAEPDEIAGLVLFLASDAAGYIVGETVIADGGYIHA